MNILYCRVGWSTSYTGDPLINGGAYNRDNIGFETYNFLSVGGKYYGFVEPGVNSSIHVERFGTDKNATFAEGILVIWIARGETAGQRVVGWYKNATVYRTLQPLPDEALSFREMKTINQYNIYSEDVTLLDVSERKKLINGIGQKNIWYGNPETDREIIEYVSNYDNANEKRINDIEEGLGETEGSEKTALLKVRINQDVFRDNLLKKYKHCCLCSVNKPGLLVASHIKPWSKSDNHEKLDTNNGLLLCPNHDKLFDSGFISFSDTGEILISEGLDEINCTFMNVRPGMKIEVTNENYEYLKYHRTFIFKK